MSRIKAALVALLVVAGTMAAVPAAGLAPGLGAPDGGEAGAGPAATNGSTPENGSAAGNATGNESIAPGAQLTGIVGVQKAEIEGEVESRGFAIALNRSEGNASKAAVIAGQVRNLNASLDRLRERKADLRSLRNDSAITNDTYRARMAELAARMATVKRLANQTENASQGIPEDTLRQNGVNPNAIRELKRNAKNLTGPGVAEIAREIAGEGAGKGLGPPDHAGPPVHVGPPGDDNDTGPPGDPGPPDDDGDGSDGSDGDDDSNGPPLDIPGIESPGGSNDTGTNATDDGGDGGDDDDGPMSVGGASRATSSLSVVLATRQ